MKYCFLIFVFVLLWSVQSYAQDKRIQENGQTYLMHKVKQGETIFSLCQTYSVSKKELLNDNPNLLFGLKAGQTLKIPVDEVQPKQKQEAVKQELLPVFHTYRVRRRDSMYSIAKKFEISVDDILKYNPIIKEEGLQRGQRLKIPDSIDLRRIKKLQAQKKRIEKAPESPLNTHKVVGDETLYSISRKYNCSIAALLAANPEAKKGLKIGMELVIPKPTTEPVAEKKEVATNGFFTHLVESGETFWGLERKYHVTKDQLVKYNPALANGLLAGLRIKIPVSSDLPDIKVEPVDQSAFEKHEVKHGETLYSLSNQYDVNISQIKEANPVLNYRGLMAGETILIPKKSEVAETQQKAPEQTTRQEPVEPAKPLNHKVKIIARPQPVNCMPDPEAAYQQYNVALMLPFYLPANDTVNRVHMTHDEMLLDSTLMSQFDDPDDLPADTFKIREEKIIYPRSESFMHFYEGVLLAVDSLQTAGMKINLHVYDTNQDKAVVDSLIHLDEFQQMDLIIGPVFPNLQGPVANFAYENHIPMVSPLSSKGNYEDTNPYYFKVNPTKDYLIRQTADYIGEEYFNKNLVVLQMGEYRHLPEAKLVNLCREKFFSSGFGDSGSDVRFNEYEFHSDGYWGLRRILSKKRENVFIIPAETEAQVSVAVSNINSLSDDYPVTLVGMSNFQRYQSIQPDYFHHVNLHLLSPFYVDYQSNFTNEFIRKFRKNFSAEPNQFSFQGYDVAYYFMSALYQYGKNFTDCLAGHQVDLNQGEFYFEKVSRNGGYMNQGLFIVHYKRDYTTAVDGIEGIPTLMISEK
ncbi:MAG TPA: LysM peptidoglycan-binding domain-containing protein [Sunxiuqinia sp.]|nr:LysM peptidoglycan-binding domain-containing protein [Sunxiuqinia sp.]